jgi:putative flippase GtrA
MAQATRAGLAQSPGVQQFVKFCIIGFSSAIIDVGISYTLIYMFSFNATLAKVISFLFAVTNGFFWNSRWTFQGMGSGRRHEMYVKFLLVNCVGLTLNVLIFKSVLFLFIGKFIGQGKPDRLHFAMATIVAIVCVSTWNFLANKKWTFKPHAN